MDSAHVKEHKRMIGSEVTSESTATPWLNVRQAAKRAQVGVKLIYREVGARRLRAAKVGGRSALRFRAEWIDAWLDAATTIREV
jgi:excisionase family DNA binding protein